jgi:GPN-loop GTPase
MSASESAAAAPDPPVAIVCVGMAGRFIRSLRITRHTLILHCKPGSGKTTFMRRINSYLHSKKEPPYVINLDPAVLNVPFESNIDIRESINYEEVMRQYNLGPNGGILTSLNLFATKVDQILGFLEKRAAPDPLNPERMPIKNILVDTRGCSAPKGGQDTNRSQLVKSRSLCGLQAAPFCSSLSLLHFPLSLPTSLTLRGLHRRLHS